MANISELHFDPRNARKHPKRNLDLLESSLREVGAARSIVIDEDNVILAGNATVETAGQIGIENLKIVDVDGDTIVAVRRTGLTDAQKQKLALYDNRVAELAEWNPEVLSELIGEGVDLSKMWSEDELNKLLDMENSPLLDNAQVPISEQYLVMVTCTSESDQSALLERLTEEGRLCRALTS